MENNESVRNRLKHLYRTQQFTNGTVSMRPAHFMITEDHLLGEHTINETYQDAEIKWYESMDRRVDKLAEIYGQRVRIWDRVADWDENGQVNSHYGHCIYSKERGYQYEKCLETLATKPGSRQAVMLYQPLNMHDVAKRDFTCTNVVQYFLSTYGDESRPRLDVVVQMRSNDAVYGFNNDLAWQKHVQAKLSKDLWTYHNIESWYGDIYWQVGDLHVYQRHWNLLK